MYIIYVGITNNFLGVVDDKFWGFYSNSNRISVAKHIGSSIIYICLYLSSSVDTECF